MVRFSDIFKRDEEASRRKKPSQESPPAAPNSEKEGLKKEKPTEKKESPIRISEKVKEEDLKKSPEKKETSKIYLSETLKEGEREKDKEKEKAYKEMETKISAFRLTQIVRERERLAGSPKEFYDEVLRKVLSFWGKLEKKESFDLSSLKNLITSLLESLKNSLAILESLPQSYPPENYLPYHSLNVSLIALTLGLGLKWETLRLQDLGLAALLHDVGMTEIPKEIYLKPEPLKKLERAKVELHPRSTLEILKKIGSLNENIIQMAFQHHERLDGGGYPQRLKGKDIHPGARILGLADVFEAMTHPRLYHPMKLSYEVLIELIEEKDKNFDKAVLKVLINEITFYPLGSLVQLNTGEMAMVECTSPEYPTRPKVRVVLSEGGEKLEPPREISLSREKLLYVQRPIFLLEKEREVE